MYYNNTSQQITFYVFFINILQKKIKIFLANTCFIKNNAYLCTVQVRIATCITIAHQTKCNVKQIKFRNNESNHRKRRHVQDRWF